MAPWHRKLGHGEACWGEATWPLQHGSTDFCRILHIQQIQHIQHYSTDSARFGRIRRLLQHSTHSPTFSGFYTFCTVLQIPQDSTVPDGFNTFSSILHHSADSAHSAGFSGIQRDFTHSARFCTLNKIQHIQHDSARFNTIQHGFAAFRGVSADSADSETFNMVQHGSANSAHSGQSLVFATFYMIHPLQQDSIH